MFVLVQHGGKGSPELVSGVYDGDTANYNHMLERVIAQGVHAFAPQLLLWDKELYEINYDRQSIDERIKSAISCSFFNSRDNYPWLDWTWFGFADKFDDAEIACMVYPRKLCIQIGKNDALFDYKGGETSYERLKNLSKDKKENWLTFIEFDGGHEFCKEDESIKELVKHILIKAKT